MDRSVTPDLHALLAPEGAGGLVDVAEPLDPASLAATANEYGARFAQLHGPATKTEVIAALHEQLGAAGWTGHNWDALEEVLGTPSSAQAWPLVIAWHDPGHLDPAAARIFRSIIESAAERRAQAGDGALLVVAGPSRQSEAQS